MNHMFLLGVIDYQYVIQIDKGILVECHTEYLVNESLADRRSVHQAKWHDQMIVT